MSQWHELLIDVLQDRPVAYHPLLAKALKSVTAALFLSRLMEWSGSLPPERDGWMYKTRQEMYEETGLSRAEQESARQILLKRGLIEEKRRGVPCKMWYRVLWDNLFQALEDYHAAQAHQTASDGSPKPEEEKDVSPTQSSDSFESDQPVGGKVTNQLAEKWPTGWRKSSQLNTKELTKEPTKDSALTERGRAPLPLPLPEVFPSQEERSEVESGPSSTPPVSLSREKGLKRKKDCPPPAAVHPGVKVFREVRRAWPAREAWPLIEAAVGTAPESLELWRKVLVAYAACGWNRQSVTGPLDFYSRGEIPRNGGRAAPVEKRPPEKRLLADPNVVRERIRRNLERMQSKEVLRE